MGLVVRYGTRQRISTSLGRNPEVGCHFMNLFLK